MTEHLPECLHLQNWIWSTGVCGSCGALRQAYEQGQRDALNAAKDAVEAMDLHGCLPRGPLACNCVGPQVIAAIAAIKGDQP